MNIILGGTHGLGLEIANLLKSKDRPTYLIGRSYNEKIHGLGMKADLSSQVDIKNIIDRLVSINIESFFWVAGYGYMGDFADQDGALRMSEVNFSNVIPIIHKAWVRMSNVDGSHLVVISSTTGVKARANEAVYAATKHAQVGFTRSLGLESERLKLPIKVALILPGGMQTPFWDNNKPENFDTYLNSAKVAREIINDIDKQKTTFFERTIERGSI